METVGFVLYPLIVVMRWALEALHAMVGSYGLAIVLLSVLVRIVVLPITRKAAEMEERHAAVMVTMEPEIAEIKQRYKGRERFERIDEVYTRNRYHPIHAMASILPLLLQLPFLLSALVLLSGHEPLQGVGFLMIDDLSRPDHLLAVPAAGLAVNLLPLLLTLVAIVEAFIKPSNLGGRLKFVFVAVVIVILIYPLPSALCVYWLTSNLWSLGAELLRQYRTASPERA